MAEWFKAVVLKTTRRKPRGFESHSLLQERNRGGRIVGLVRRFAKPLWEQSHRGFESLPPRHSVQKPRCVTVGFLVFTRALSCVNHWHACKRTARSRGSARAGN